MVGQGRPNSRRNFLALLLGSMAWLLAVCTIHTCGLLAAEPTQTLRLRIEWGGGAERQWQGNISVDQGTISILRPLGIVSDVPGSIWSAGNNRIEIKDRSSRAYDGMDVEIVAPVGASLRISLKAESDSEVVINRPLPVDKTVRGQLDKQGNQVFIRQVPGDMLRVSTNRDSVVFSPGESWDLDVSPQVGLAEAGTTVHLKSRLTMARGGPEVWSQEQTLKWPGAGEPPPSSTLRLVMPQQEGAYDLVIEASQRGPLPLRLTKTLGERQVQLVVVDSQPPADSAASGWAQVMEIDPTSSHWYDLRRAIPKLPSFIPYANNIWQGPLVNGSMTVVDTSAGRAMELSPRQPDADPSWVAYPLSARPGVPHMLEVEYPAEGGQTLGISIVEPNAAGNVRPYGLLDSGVYTSDEPVGAGRNWAKHRLLFWPHTSAPLVLLVNRRDGRPARFGKIHVSTCSRLPRAFPRGDSPPERLLAGYFDRPRFTANFCGSEAYDPVSRRSLTDWQTFFEGGTRLTDYLNSTGYNGVMLNVASEGSAIYPSKLLQPTPRFDTGAFFDEGQDPRKDVLEVLLRLFDRENLRFIPSLEFSSPLPELEALLRDGGPAADGIQLIGPGGVSWSEVQSSARGFEPGYNVLDERVQHAVLAVVHELVERYSHHPSLGGLGIELSAHGYMELPGDLWGLDDQTIHRFESEMRVDTGGGDGPGRFAARARFVSDPAGRKDWHAWRCSKLAKFHRQIAKELEALRPDARLYLIPVDMFELPEIASSLRPTLPPNYNVIDSMACVGIRPDLYQQDSKIVLLRTQQIESPGSLAAQAVSIQLNRSVEWDRAISALPSPGCLQYNEPQWLRLPSFDAKSSLGKDRSFTALLSEFSPSEETNRQRFAHSLATLDSQSLFDGGWWMPMGQEESMAPWVAAYRRLPAARFYKLQNCPQPLTVRTAQTPAGTFVYFVNDSRWEIKVQLQTNAPQEMTPRELGGSHAGTRLGSTWTLELAPYDLAVYQFDAHNVQFFGPQVDMDEAGGALAAAVEDFKQRCRRLATQPAMPALLNSDFEMPAAGNAIPGWSIAGAGHATIESNDAQQGKQSLRLSSNGDWVSLRSEPFNVPKGGRMQVSVFLKVDDPSLQPEVRLKLEGQPASRQYRQSAPLGAGSKNLIPAKWQRFNFSVPDGPTEGLQALRFCIELKGQSSLLVDDVQLFDLVFTDSEQTQLNSLLAQMDWQLNARLFGDCQYELEQYWPRFLKENVPLASPVAVSPQPAQTVPPEKAATRPGVVDRVKGFLKL